ncbi:MAG: GNAT family N-acetyltransferase [Nanoarchaeota archaeon]|nr:GNAT family N-acetyltransferase [Nanoarchaeota archaeon]
MRLGDDSIQIIPFESCHGALFYKWHLSGKYKQFFGNLEIIPLEKWNQLKNAYMIVDANDINTVYGCYVLRDIDQQNKNISLHMMIDDSVQKKGIGKKSVPFFLFYVFNQLNFYKIIARTSEDNKGVMNLFSKMGFKYEGLLKKHVLCDGERIDLHQYALMKPQFNREIGDKLKKSASERVVSAA